MTRFPEHSPSLTVHGEMRANELWLHMTIPVISYIHFSVYIFLWPERVASYCAETFHPITLMASSQLSLCTAFTLLIRPLWLDRNADINIPAWGFSAPAPKPAAYFNNNSVSISHWDVDYNVHLVSGSDCTCNIFFLFFPQFQWEQTSVCVSRVQPSSPLDQKQFSLL